MQKLAGKLRFTTQLNLARLIVLTDSPLFTRGLLRGADRFYDEKMQLADE